MVLGCQAAAQAAATRLPAEWSACSSPARWSTKLHPSAECAQATVSSCSAAASRVVASRSRPTTCTCEMPGRPDRASMRRVTQRSCASSKSGRTSAAAYTGLIGGARATLSISCVSARFIHLPQAHRRSSRPPRRSAGPQTLAAAVHGLADRVAGHGGCALSWRSDGYDTLRVVLVPAHRHVSFRR